MADFNENDVSEIQVQKSIIALKAYLNTSNDGKHFLLKDTETVYVIFSVKKLLPIAHKRWKLFKVIMPHMPLEDNPSICLFVKDLKKGRKADDDQAIWHFKQFLADRSITGVSEIIPFHMLRTHYKPFETKRHLASNHDLFLCDSRIQGYLPRILGKEFLQRNRLPLKLDFSSKTLHQEFLTAYRTTSVHLNGVSSSYHLRLGLSGFSEEKLLGNFLAACESLKKHLPGGWLNVKSLHVKTENSPAIPVYFSQESGKSVKFQKKKTKRKIVTDELSTLLNGNIDVHPDGRVQIKRTFTKENDDHTKSITGIADNDSGRESGSETEDELEEIEKKYISKRQKMGERLKQNSS